MKRILVLVIAGLLLVQAGIVLGTTYRNYKLDKWGTSQIGFGRFDFDSSYPTGGEAFSGAMFGVPNPDMVIPIPEKAGWFVMPDSTLSYLVVMAPDEDTVSGDVMVEADNETDLSALTCRVICIDFKN